MNTIFPQKLKKGDKVMVVAPSMSLSIISQETREMANKRFADMGLELHFSKHAEESDEFLSSSIESRVEDLHAAFGDPEIKMVLTVIGGFNCNQLLRYLDWDLIRKNPKIFCGYSDTTALQHAILAKTGLVTYSGPAYSTFGERHYFDYTLDYFQKCLFGNAAFEVMPSDTWSDDKWYLDQENRKPIPNDGWWVLNEGDAQGTIIGGNLCTLQLLQGTEYFPSLNNSILFLEDDEESKPHHIDRNLQSLIHLADFSHVKALVIGRFQNTSEMSREKLVKIIKTKRELNSIPVIANVDFGHTSSIITFPIGGKAAVSIHNGKSRIQIVGH